MLAACMHACVAPYPLCTDGSSYQQCVPLHVDAACLTLRRCCNLATKPHLPPQPQPRPRLLARRRQALHRRPLLPRSCAGVASCGAATGSLWASITSRWRRRRAAARPSSRTVSMRARAGSEWNLPMQIAVRLKPVGTAFRAGRKAFMPTLQSCRLACATCVHACMHACAPAAAAVPDHQANAPHAMGSAASSSSCPTTH